MSSLGTRVEAEYGRGFGKRNLLRVIRVAEVLAECEIMTIPFRPVARAASASTSGEKADMARRACRTRHPAG